MIINKQSSVPQVQPHMLDIAHILLCAGDIHKQGSGSYIVLQPNGECIGGGTKLYGNTANTNNKDESKALVHGLQYIAIWAAKLNGDKKNISAVHSNSNLMISFMQKIFSPNKKALVLAIREAKHLEINLV